MGLLTDPGVEGSRIPAVLHAYHRPVAVLLYIVGVAWALGLAHNALNHATYFSENALLPGLVQGEFLGETQAQQYLQALNTEAERHPAGLPYAWLMGQFSQLGLDTYTHNFTLHYPLSENKAFSGKNVYAILRAMRGSSTESVVVSAPYRPLQSVHQSTAPSVALMLALAQFFSEQVYWAKDIIFLVTEHEQLGAQAWLEAYHRTSCGSGVLDYGDLPARAGPIQAAVNLEIHSAKVSHIDIKVEGLNGQLPNLDLVNLIHRLCHRENVLHTFKNKEDHPQPETFHGWLHQLKTLVAMVTTQATGVPNGNHGLFHRYGIAAVTIEGARESGRTRRSSSLLQLGRVLEGICRSLNNLLERFHQSFFFYILPATNRYISIGVYMPPFGAIGGTLLVVALALWYSTSWAASEQEKQTSSHTTPNKSGHEQVNYSVRSFVPLLFLVHVVSLVLAQCPRYLCLAGSEMSMTTEDSVFLGISALSTSLLLLPSCTTSTLRLASQSWEVLKCIAVLELSVLVFAGSVYNFPLALIITIIYAPVALAVAPSSRRVVRWCRAFLMLLCHPLILLLLFVLMDTYMTFPELPLDRILWKSVFATKRALTYSIIDFFIYGNWVFEVAAICLLPVWLLFWYIIMYPI